MRKYIAIFLTVLFLLALTGCTRQQDIPFYYPRTEIQYGVSDGVIAVESRNIPPEDQNLEYLLKLYLEGPISQDLYAPFPVGTSLISQASDASGICITLSDSFASLQNLDYTIACAGICATCFGLTDAESVTIISGETSITMTRQGLSFQDQSWQNSHD